MTDLQPTYREIEARDLPIAQDMRATMIRELNGADPDQTRPQWRRRYVEFYAPKMERGRAALFIADIDKRPVGVAAVYLLANHRSEIFGYQSGYISNVWVEPKHRKKGIASRLTQMAVDWARAKGCEVVRLRSSPMGRSVYAALGFQSTDEMEIRFA